MKKIRIKIISILLVALNVILIGTNAYAQSTRIDNSAGSNSRVQNNIEVQDIQIYEKLEKDYQVGFTTYLTAIITPSNATNKDVTWTSSNEDIALIYPSGKFVALKPGTVKITATASNGKKSTRTVKITETNTEENTMVNDSNIINNDNTKKVNKQENQSPWIIVVLILVVLAIGGYIGYSQYKKKNI